MAEETEILGEKKEDVLSEEDFYELFFFEEESEEEDSEELEFPDEFGEKEEDEILSFYEMRSHPVGTPLVGTSPKLRDKFTLSGVLKSDPTVLSVAGTAGETTLNSYAFLANEWHPNMTVRVRAAGRYTTDDATATVAIALKVGSTTYHTITTTAATVTNAPWCIDWLLVVNTTGSSGTMESQASAKTNNVNKDSANTATIAIDTTAGQTLSATATWTSGSAGDNISIRQFLVELLN